MLGFKNVSTPESNHRRAGIVSVWNTCHETRSLGAAKYSGWLQSWTTASYKYWERADLLKILVSRLRACTSKMQTRMPYSFVKSEGVLITLNPPDKSFFVFGLKFYLPRKETLMKTVILVYRSASIPPVEHGGHGHHRWRCQGQTTTACAANQPATTSCGVDKGQDQEIEKVIINQALAYILPKENITGERLNGVEQQWTYNERDTINEKHDVIKFHIYVVVPPKYNICLGVVKLGELMYIVLYFISAIWNIHRWNLL